MNGAPFLELEKKVSVHGVVKDRQSKPIMAKPPMVKAVLVRDAGSPVPVVWWDEMDAPPEGSRVSVSGTVLESFGELYISVEDTRWLRPHPEGLAPGTHPYHRLLRYLYECVEAESGLDTILDPKDDRILILQEGRDPAVTRNAETGGPVYLTREEHQRWFQIQTDAGRESVLLGYPVIVGTRVETGKPQTRLAPLFVVECEWKPTNAESGSRGRTPPTRTSLPVPSNCSTSTSRSASGLPR